ncbi:SPASM domain-containing protein [Nocardia sp. NBC_01377]|uniref:SPASM domain-containing protein n=1 Tax=Nocardia sp. NBC_01377 TaxID=2903595 RepID=UPI00324724B3
MGAPLPVVGQLGHRPEAPHRVSWELTHDHEASEAVFPSTAVRELGTAECLGLVEEFDAMGVPYLDIVGGEPMVRTDFWRIVDAASARRIGVGFRTDGATEATNDPVGGAGAYRAAVRAMELLYSSGVYDFAVDVVLTERNMGQLDAMAAVADLFGVRLRTSSPRSPRRTGRPWYEPRPSARQQLDVRRRQREIGDAAADDHGQTAVGCGAGRTACLIDATGDVYACPFASHEALLAGNIGTANGFAALWRYSPLFEHLRGAENDALCVSCGGHHRHEDILASVGRSA